MTKDLTKDSRRRILCVFPQLTGDLAKSAHLLILRHGLDLGCSSVVLTVGSSRDAAGTIKREWHGLEVYRLVPESWRWNFMQRLAEWRRVSGKQGIRRSASRIFRLILMPLANIVGFPDAHVAATNELIQCAKKLHTEQAFDAVLTLYFPLSAHKVGQKLSRDFGIPWIALTKDFYSWPDELKKGIASSFLNRMKRRIEPIYYRDARAIVSISQYMNQYLATLHTGRPLHVLGHCFDEDSYPEQMKASDCVATNGRATMESSSTGTFNLTCVGLTQQNDLPAIRCLFSAISQERDAGRICPNQLQVKFVGHNGELVRRLSQELDVADYVNVISAVTHATAMQELCEADCLFYMQTPFGTRRRLTEYVGAQRPILAYPSYPGEFSEDLLIASGLGRVTNSTSEIRAELRRMLDEYDSFGTVQMTVNRTIIERQSSRFRAKELLRILDEFAPIPDSYSGGKIETGEATGNG